MLLIIYFFYRKTSKSQLLLSLNSDNENIFFFQCSTRFDVITSRPVLLLNVCVRLIVKMRDGK